MAQYNLNNAVEVADEFDDSISEEKYREDLNRLSKKIHAENLQSRAEFDERLNNYDASNQIEDTFRELLWRTRAKEYVDKNNPPEEEKPKDKRRKYTAEQEQYLIDNPNIKVGRLFTMALFSGKSKAGLYAKRRRLLSKALR